MLVRLALKSDEDRIVELARINHGLSTPYLEFSEEKCRETVQSYLDTAAPTIFVAEEDGHVVGLLLATINGFRHATGLYVASEVLFVDPAYHGSRAAILLMNELIDWAKLLGAVEISGGNDNSLKTDRTTKFLEHFGFEQVGSFMRRMVQNG